MIANVLLALVLLPALTFLVAQALGAVAIPSRHRPSPPSKDDA